MSKVGQKDTKPELALRRALHGLGYRFRLHRRDLPGSPDIVFPSRRKVVFVHGCFWLVMAADGGDNPSPGRNTGCRRLKQTENVIRGS